MRRTAYKRPFLAPRRTPIGPSSVSLLSCEGSVRKLGVIPDKPVDDTQRRAQDLDLATDTPVQPKHWRIKITNNRFNAGAKCDLAHSFEQRCGRK
jgi:hypothetical protein